MSAELGHASVQITLDRYGHLMDQSYGDASARLEAALFGGHPPKVSPASPVRVAATGFLLAAAGDAETP